MLYKLQVIFHPYKCQNTTSCHELFKIVVHYYFVDIFCPHHSNNKLRFERQVPPSYHRVRAHKTSRLLQPFKLCPPEYSRIRRFFMAAFDRNVGWQWRELCQYTSCRTKKWPLTFWFGDLFGVGRRGEGGTRNAVEKRGRKEVADHRERRSLSSLHLSIY